MYARTNGNRRMALTSQDPRDDEVMRRVAAGSADALGVLHRRFARLIFAIAVRSLDRAAAEDLVQDVFLAVWRNADRFDPERGTVRAWILQIAHFRLLNELRRRSRQPEMVALGVELDERPADVVRSHAHTLDGRFQIDWKRGGRGTSGAPRTGGDA